MLQATPRTRCKGHSWTWCPQVWDPGYRTYHVGRIPSYIWLMLLVNVGKLYHIGYIDAMDSTEYIHNFQMQVSHSTCSYLWSLWNYPSNNYVSRNYRSPSIEGKSTYCMHTTEYLDDDVTILHMSCFNLNYIVNAMIGYTSPRVPIRCWNLKKLPRLKIFYDL